MKFDIIGLGPGTGKYLLPIAKNSIEKADCLIGARRLIGLFRNLQKEEIPIEGHFADVIPYLRRYKDKKRIALLVSGDPGLYSMLDRISKAFPPEDYTVIPGISTLQLAFAKIGEAWHDAKAISLHGRKVDTLADEIRSCAKTFLFTDSGFPPNKIARHLLKEGVRNRRAIVMKDLSYPNEKILDTDLEHLSGMKMQGRCVMIIKELDRESRKGKLYGMGIGPGDPKLITLRAKEMLERVDIVFVPKAKGDSVSLARSIVESVTRTKKAFIEIVFPMTRERSILKRYWRRAASIIAKEIGKGKEAAYITIGDPSIYSTYAYLLKTIRRNFPNIEVETIPGISAFNAAAAAADVTLVEGDEDLAILPVTGDLKAVRDALKKFNTVVLMKVGSRLKKVVLLLKELGLAKDAILISRVGHRDKKIIRNLSSMRYNEAGYLSVIIVKKGRR